MTDPVLAAAAEHQQLVGDPAYRAYVAAYDAAVEACDPERHDAEAVGVYAGLAAAHPLLVAERKPPITNYYEAVNEMFKAQERAADIHRDTLTRLRREFAARYDEQFSGQTTVRWADVEALGVPCDDCLTLRERRRTAPDQLQHRQGTRVSGIRIHRHLRTEDVLTTSDEPDWVRQLHAGIQGFADQMAHAGHILAAQGAMGWVYRGDLDRAREALTKLPPDALQQVSVAATALSSLAEELASQAPSGAQ